MTTRLRFLAVVPLAAALLAAGCSTADSGAPASPTSSAASAAVSEPAAGPTGAPIGTATIEVQGSGTATIRYSINGAAEQVAENVALPWTTEYEVYPKISTKARAEGTGAAGCTIMMDGKLVSFVTGPNPECTFAYY